MASEHEYDDDYTGQHVIDDSDLDKEVMTIIDKETTIAEYEVELSNN
ncbi:MAG: hypothetical protein QM504_08030 [Pseudomonadota bacterium]